MCIQGITYVPTHQKCSCGNLSPQHTTARSSQTKLSIQVEWQYFGSLNNRPLPQKDSFTHKPLFGFHNNSPQQDLDNLTTYRHQYRKFMPIH